MLEDESLDAEQLRSELRKFLNFLPDALLEVSIEFDNPQVTYMNRMAHILFGYSEEDFQGGIDLRQIFDSMDEFKQVIEIAHNYVDESIDKHLPYTRNGVQELFEFRMKRKNGETFFAEVQASTVLNKEDIPYKVRAIFRDITKRKELERDREKLIKELQVAIKNIQSLQGLLPICASCKRIRDTEGQWSELEEYIENHSEAEFSHGICPDCMEKLYPGIRKK